MAVYALDQEAEFPNPELADADGLLAVGGKLSIEWLMTAYAQGVFPWYDDINPILWWSPDPRLVLYPKEFKLRKSLRRVLKQRRFEIRFDHQFRKVIEECAQIPRAEEQGTWITSEMLKAYVDLHEYGAAHSLEVYEKNELVGGLYGVSLGKAFFGESMFFKKRDASKVALYYLCKELRKWGFHFIDAQVETDHLISLGAEKITRTLFLEKLDEALKQPTCLGKWTKTIQHEF